MPPGGPVDRDPPVIIHSQPSAGETHVDLDANVQIWFSEPVKAGSASDAVFISPYSGDQTKFKWHGRRLKILFPETLKPNQTYVITFGTGIRDLRNNQLEESYSLAFSTGETIDQGKILGNVIMEGDMRGIDVWAYRLTEAEEPDPSCIKPDYIVQCGQYGQFEFSHLVDGGYRIFAVHDRIKDRLYQPVEDDIGVPNRDVKILGDSIQQKSPLWIRLTREDTIPPALVRQIALDESKVLLQFNEIVQLTDDFSVTIFSKVTTNIMEPLAISESYRIPYQKNQIQLITENQIKDTLYMVTVRGIIDQSGNPLDSNHSSGVFFGSEQSDTTSPKLIKTYPVPREELVPVELTCNFQFDEPIERASLDEGFTFSDSSGNEEKGSIEWISPVEFVFKPNHLLSDKMVYYIGFSNESVMDLARNILADTVFHFKTVNIDTLSEISGKVIDSDSALFKPYIIGARQLENPDIYYRIHLQGIGEYQIQNILPGRYILECFCDYNQDGEYSYGQPFPFKLSERFIVYQDTIKVRSRWPNSGNNLRLE